MNSSARRAVSRMGTFRQLEILLGVAEHGGIAAAAERLHLTQPSASMQLKKLTESIGVPLYEVVGRRVKFTDAGEVMVAAAREIFDTLERSDMQLNQLQGMQSGRMSIAVVKAAEYFFPHLLGPFCRQYPDIEVELWVGNHAEVHERLMTNRDDLYLLGMPPETAGLQTLEFQSNALVVIAPSSHPLAGRKHIDWRDIEAEGLILREEGSGTRLATERYLAAQGYQYQHRMTIASNEAIKHAVLARMGLAVIPAHTLAEGDMQNLVQLDVKGFPIVAPWYLVGLKEKTFSVAAATFRDFMQAEGGPMLEGGLRYWERHHQPKLPTK